MATSADQRLLELLGKWLESLELHAKYSSLDDDSYWNIQPWAEHQRPSRWIVDLAKQKTLALQAQLEERMKAGDTQFSDSLELMTFLANLVGSEHIERFIPVADAKKERPPQSQKASPAAPDSGTGTHEMPQMIAAPPTAPALAGTAQVARGERKAPAAFAKPLPKAAPKPPPKKGLMPDMSSAADTEREQIIADAARLVQWGRKWFELPELIARMADRPNLAEVRRILKDNKAAIEKKAGVG